MVRIDGFIPNVVVKIKPCNKPNNLIYKGYLSKEVKKRSLSSFPYADAILETPLVNGTSPRKSEAKPSSISSLELIKKAIIIERVKINITNIFLYLLKLKYLFQLD